MTGTFDLKHMTSDSLDKVYDVCKTKINFLGGFAPFLLFIFQTILRVLKSLTRKRAAVPSIFRCRPLKLKRASHVLLNYPNRLKLFILFCIYMNKFQ